MPDASEDLAKIIESARRLGIEINEAEALQWLAAMSATAGGGDVVVDAKSGVFGHEITMLDFGQEQLARFREVGRIVELKDRPGVVETALALSGSAAQSKIHTYPGDCDYFERVNIKTPTRQEACRLLADLIRAKVLDSEKGPTYALVEVKFGSYPYDVLRESQPRKKGTPISWSPAEVRRGSIEAVLPDGAPTTLLWDEVALDPGWCKLDWLVADPARRGLANAGNMLDVTWEAPDGTITPLDGYLDAYFQEVYLEAESLPIFSKLARHVSTDALDNYVHQLEKEIKRYVAEHPNYGKAARRMYNVFRLTGRYPEAAYIRELFDEPTTLLYQVWSLIKTLDEATRPGSGVPLDSVISQADELIISVIRALEGSQETEIVRSLLHLRDTLTGQHTGHDHTAEVEAARAQVVNMVNNFFQDKLVAMPTIREYIETLRDA